MTVEPSKPGLRRCLKCDKEFMSPDYIKIRRCPDCHRNEDNSSPRVIQMRDVYRALRGRYRE